VRQNRRRFQLIIDRDFQYSYSLKVFIYLAVILLVFFITHLFLLNANYEVLTQNALKLMPDSVMGLKKEFSFFVKLHFFSFFTLLVVLLFVLLQHSKRVAGPLYALKRHILFSKKSQDFKPLKLRNGDDFQELVHSYNELCSEMKLTESALLKKVNQLEKLLSVEENSQKKK